MSRLSQLLVATSALVAVAAAYEKCYKEGERCIGAPGKPAVAYKPCCDGMSCSADDKTYGGYGKVCAKPVAPKCYKEGERCMGAPGKPAVPYSPCCDGMSCSADDKTYNGYGKVCAKGYAPVAPKCYKEGERCIGAPGKPAVAYSPCCDGMSCSADDKTYNGYGKVCAKGYAPVAPKCYKEGERCIGAPGKPAVAYSPCCDGMSCSADDKTYNGYGKVCAKGYAPVAPKCVKDGQECKQGGDKCCGKSKCVRAYGKYAFECQSAGTSAPTTTVKKCVAEEGKCGKGYDVCCDGTSCVKAKKYSNEERCMKY